MDVRIENSWKTQLAREWDAPYFNELTQFVKSEYSTKTIFPPASRIFAAMDACPFDKVKAVIVGQDPYHGPGQANGLCFSVADGVPHPPSLVNIFKEISEETGCPYPASGDLSRWARQGVLLLNSVLTVESGRAGSHANRGWERFTDAIISQLNRHASGIVFMLWGNYAINKGKLIDRSRHRVLTSAHPSPLSAYRGFFGNHHFTLANDYLKSVGKTPVIW